ncbi:hypothetical protein NO263_02085 [Gluconacetobacter entanii]|uniref:Sel1 repeat family protein n=1 Tax=Gluconacetobacter entanii TaxID=108528 RepID=A0ABT3K1U9_9PROT|nr:hypothetical protein [Gluconacetobacter entanii]MCW4589379.1 hypothetical protein [Gluconacetobacter entanii]MCW4593010.1 hypothetical protein [Gluconacetobacter entanii]NPC90214.1 hypothetical protein [Gluconacetobacter entanii]
MFYKNILFSFFIIASCGTSYADDLYNNSDAVQEAKFRLTDCEKDSSDIKSCKFEQSEFVEEYQNAYAGDYLAQQNVGYMLLRGGDGAVRKNPFEACAWHTLAIRSKSPYIRSVERDQARISCTEPVSQYGKALEGQISEMTQAIRAHGVHRVAVPEIDYDPKRDRDETNSGG